MVKACLNLINYGGFHKRRQKFREESQKEFYSPKLNGQNRTMRRGGPV